MVILDLLKRVFRTLGSGYSECVYQKAIECELAAARIRFESEKVIPVTYPLQDGSIAQVGAVRADVVITEPGLETVIEMKNVDNLDDGHVFQLQMYLRHSGIPQGILFSVCKKKEVMKYQLVTLEKACPIHTHNRDELLVVQGDHEQDKGEDPDAGLNNRKRPGSSLDALVRLDEKGERQPCAGDQVDDHQNKGIPTQNRAIRSEKKRRHEFATHQKQDTQNETDTDPPSVPSPNTIAERLIPHPIVQ
jgi:GxxExxY protein